MSVKGKLSVRIFSPSLKTAGLFPSFSIVITHENGISTSASPVDPESSFVAVKFGAVTVTLSEHVLFVSSSSVTEVYGSILQEATTLFE